MIRRAVHLGDRLRAAFDDAKAERAYWESHSAELLEQHAERFVAVQHGSVVAVAPSLDELLEALRDKGITDPRSVWVRFITAEPRRLSLIVALRGPDSVVELIAPRPHENDSRCWPS